MSEGSCNSDARGIFVLNDSVECFVTGKKNVFVFYLFLFYFFLFGRFASFSWIY